MVIRVLPPDVVNQIAAGEVVERPFSVVKELVENSLDAGARRIRVEIEDGGRTSVRVQDDGAGFEAGDLELAFASHATSKLASADDLAHIASLGFRGEALASVGSVAHVRIRSRPAPAKAGNEIECHGGSVGEVRPCGCPPGTTVEVRDLFFNTPARRRFLRTPRAEAARVQETVVRLALARLDVEFALVADGRQLLRLPAEEGLVQRVERAFGRRVGGTLHEVERGSGGYRVTGLAGDPDAARRDGTMELLWVNGRFAKDRASGAAVRQAYRAYLMPGRMPVYFLHLALPPDEVDVNVHPTKAEVRFREGRRVAGLLHDAVRGALEARGLAPRAAALGVAEGKPRARSGFPDLPQDLFGRVVSPPAPRAAIESRGGADPGAASGASESEPPGEAAREPTPGAPSVRADAVGEPAMENPFGGLRDARFLQVLDCYLVLGGRDGLVVVDQHALHERVVYERLVRRARERGTQVQRLLIPEVVEVAPRDKAWLLEVGEALAQEGFLLEDFGGDAVAIHGMPAVLGRARPRAVLEAFLVGDDAADARPRAREAVLERFHSMACRGSVMRGDPLGEGEIRALLAEAATLEHPHNCPHGRPTVLTFDRAELERFFKRRV